MRTRRSCFRPGTYTVSAEANGFTKTELTAVQLAVYQVLRLDIDLKVGSASQTVEVSAAPPILSTETSSLATVETGQRIVNLPLNGRNFTQLAWLGPGATPGSSAGIGLTTSTDDPRQGVQLAVNGLFGFDNNFLLDGVDNNEFGEGTIAVQPSPDALQTFSIEESSMKAEFGRGGAAVNAVLKSGTNAFHGGGFEYFRNSALDAANYFATTGKPPFKRNQFGGFVGGPIIKDRTFFFADYQGTRLQRGCDLREHGADAGGAQRRFLRAGSKPLRSLHHHQHRVAFLVEQRQPRRHPEQPNRSGGAGDRKFASAADDQRRANQ